MAMKRAARKTQRSPISRAIARLIHDEGGAAYTLSYVMVFPILMLLVSLAIESALMLTAKLGTVHAAYVAARVATVQDASGDWSGARQKIAHAASQAMIPFASGSTRPAGSAASANILADSESDYRRAYRQWSDDSVAEGYVRSKQRDVRMAVEVNVDGPPGSWRSEITAEVTYQYPFRIPGIGRLLGERNGTGFSFPLTSRVTLPNDGPQNDTQSMGIGYGQTD